MTDTKIIDMSQHISKMWYKCAETGMWMRKGYHMPPIPLEEAYSQQLEIDARTRKVKERKQRKIGKFNDRESLVDAIKEFTTKLPDWWFTIGHCKLSRHASCGPDRQGRDAHLLEKFDDGFHCDDPNGTLSSVLLVVMNTALSAKKWSHLDD